MESLSFYPIELGNFDDYFMQQGQFGEYPGVDQSAFLATEAYQYDEYDTLEALRFMFEDPPYSSSITTSQPQCSSTQAPTFIEDFGRVSHGDLSIPPGLPPFLQSQPVSDTFDNQGWTDNASLHASLHASVQVPQPMLPVFPSSAQLPPPQIPHVFPQETPIGHQTIPTSVPQFLAVSQSEPRQFKSRSTRKTANTGRTPESSTFMITSDISKRSGISDPLIASPTPPAATLRPTKKLRGTPSSLFGVFDVNTDPNQKRNSRKTFSDDGKQKVSAVRNIGACIQCRFRKRPCGTSKPCQACFRRTGSATMAASVCVRESPFEDLSVTEFYGSSSRTRVVDFNFDFANAEEKRSVFKIDGKRATSRPIHVIVVEVETSSLSPETVAEITRIQNLGSKSPQEPSKTVTILDLDILSALDLERWATEYAYKFTKEVNIHATAFIFGIEYVERKLPHSTMVANMMKVMALHMILYHGVKINSSNGTPKNINTRILNAQIDTKLFQCLYVAEKKVYQELQRLIFKSSGQLTRDAIVPVCLTLWLLIRLQCLRASYLSNIRPKTSSDPIISTSGQPTTSASHQQHALSLLLSTFSALFRCSLPLLMDFDDRFNKDLVNDDKELVVMAKKVRGSLMWFRSCGYIKVHKKTMGYSRKHTEMIRELIK